jgi:hypothetical protein
MPTSGVSEIRSLIENAVTAISIMGGAMAYESGLAATKAIAEGLAPPIVAQRINEGLGEGFSWGLPVAIFCLIVLLWI